MASMRKYLGATDFEAVVRRVVPSYAQGDTTDVRTVYPQVVASQGPQPPEIGKPVAVPKPEAKGKPAAQEPAANPEHSGAELAYNKRNRMKTGIKLPKGGPAPRAPGRGCA